MPIYYELSLREFEKKNELMRHPPGYTKPEDDIEDGDYATESYEIDRKTRFIVKPLIPVTWHQSYPYNGNAPMISGIRAYAGYVSVAVAQLIAYYKYPVEFGGTHLDWDLLTKFKHLLFVDSITSERYSYEESQIYAHQVSSFLKAIGDALHNSWGIDETGGTGADTGDIVNLLRSMGYRNPSSLTNYDKDGIISSLDSKHPAVMRGNMEKITTTSGWWIFKKEYVTYTKGHAWLVDGYAIQDRKFRTVKRKSRKFVSEYTVSDTFIHCNWGWGGKYDGYFEPGVFNSNTPIELRCNNDKESTPGYFQYNIQNILNAYK